MKKVIGFGITGSFCTLSKALDVMERWKRDFEIIPILSERVVNTDTRFFKKEDFYERVKAICGRDPITTIPEAEPLGPKDMLDLLVICPCTGNTLSKLALGITDTTVTMAAKSHRRGGKNVLIALSTNDALSGSASNLGTLLEKKGFYFVPLRQDDPKDKPTSLQLDFSRIDMARDLALEGKQMRPLFV